MARCVASSTISLSAARTSSVAGKAIVIVAGEDRPMASIAGAEELDQHQAAVEELERLGVEGVDPMIERPFTLPTRAAARACDMVSASAGFLALISPLS